MRKYSKIIFIVLIAAFAISCEDSLNPFGDLRNKYVLNCIIRGDSTFQTATLTQSYMVTNGDPYSYQQDPAIKNALVRIWNGNDIVDFFRDTTTSEPAGSEYQRPYSVYYTNGFQPLGNSSIQIEAILPNGERLTATADVPDNVNMLPQKSSDRIPPTDGDKVIVSWFSNQTDPVYVVRLAIYYFKHQNGEKFRNVYTVPLKYVTYDNKDIPVYPKPTSDQVYAVDMNTINKAMEKISEGDSDKSKYEILSCIAEVLSLNDELSQYYNATARSSDIYSVKLDETDYSNINNGSGIFGVYMRSYFLLKFTHTYIRSFGYIPGLTDAP